MGKRKGGLEWGGWGDRDIAFDLVNVVVLVLTVLVLEHTVGHCLKPAVRRKEFVVAPVTVGQCGATGQGQSVGVGCRLVAWPAASACYLIPHMITSFHSTTIWRSNMKSVRLSLLIYLSAFTDAVLQEYILKAKVFMKGKKMGWVGPVSNIYTHVH